MERNDLLVTGKGQSFFGSEILVVILWGVWVPLYLISEPHYDGNALHGFAERHGKCKNSRRSLAPSGLYMQ